MRFGLICICILFSAVCSGEEINSSQKEKTQDQLLIGAGILAKQEAYKGVDLKVYPLPFFSYTGRRWSFQGTQFRYNFTDEDNFSVNTVLKLRTEGFDADDSSDLDGMSDRDISLDAGLGFGLSGDWGDMSTDLLTDAAGKHKGQEVKLTYSRRFQNLVGIEKLRFGPFVGASWRSSSLNDYYYGVRPGEVRPGRPAYDSGDSINYFAGVRFDYGLNQKWSLFFLFQNEWLGSEITDSPIVERHHTNSFVAGLVYRL